VLIILLTIIFFSIDFFLKKFIEHAFSFNTTYPLINNIVSLRVVHNTGAAFGILQGKRPFLIFLGIAFLAVFLFLTLRQKYSFTRKVFLSMILGGALCNLYDRIFLGYVIDYIDLGWWPVFNLSDSFITLGCSFFIISYLLDNAGKNKAGI